MVTHRRSRETNRISWRVDGRAMDTRDNMWGALTLMHGHAVRPMCANGRPTGDKWTPTDSNMKLMTDTWTYTENSWTPTDIHS